MERQNKPIAISTQALKRMHYYLQLLKTLQQNDTKIVSAPVLAKNFGWTEIQVRKDLAAISTSKGRPKAGFSVEELIYNMEEALGYNSIDKAVLVGAGSLGSALLSYKGFESYGIDIVAAFDSDESIVGEQICGKEILPANKISEMSRRMKINIGIITVPAGQAQLVCDQLVAGGIQAIWNFAPVHISAPEDILVQNENMAASLALLSKHLREKFALKNEA